MITSCLSYTHCTAVIRGLEHGDPLRHDRHLDAREPVPRILYSPGPQSGMAAVTLSSFLLENGVLTSVSLMSRTTSWLLGHEGKEQPMLV